MLSNIDWRRPFLVIVRDIEAKMGISACVNEAILLHAVRRTEESLAHLGIERPNVAKIAGCLVFWLRKLKPLSIDNRTSNYYDLLNEQTALSLGIVICETYLDDLSRGDSIRMPKRILNDLAFSLRYHSHSPHSLMTMFEVMACIE